MSLNLLIRTRLLAWSTRLMIKTCSHISSSLRGSWTRKKSRNQESAWNNLTSVKSSLSNSHTLFLRRCGSSRCGEDTLYLAKVGARVQNCTKSLKTPMQAIFNTTLQVTAWASWHAPVQILKWLFRGGKTLSVFNDRSVSLKLNSRKKSMRLLPKTTELYHLIVQDPTRA